MSRVWRLVAGAGSYYTPRTNDVVDDECYAHVAQDYEWRYPDQRLWRSMCGDISPRTGGTTPAALRPGWGPTPTCLRCVRYAYGAAS